jgi:hypothetical protein
MRDGYRRAVVSVLMCAAAVLLKGLPALMGQGTAEPPQLVVIGCIKPAAQNQAGSANAEFTITDFRGGPTPTFRLDAKDSKLIPWVGYTVEITGKIVPGSFSATSNAPPKLNVEKVQRISRSCTALEPRGF